MDTLEVNKGVAAVLLSGIVFMVAGLVGEVVVHPRRLAKPAISVEAPAGSSSAGQGAPKQEETLPPIAPLLAKADPAAGEAYVKKVCAVCHSFNQGGAPIIGPNLYNVVMAPHAHEEGYSYSSAMKAKPGKWDFDALNAWLKKPAAYVPGTKMAFPGIANDQQRADVIAWLRTLSPDPAPLPAP